MKFKNAISITISNSEWNFPKRIMLEYTGKLDRIPDMAKEVFDNYTKDMSGKFSLIDYTYFGPIDILSDDQSITDMKSVVLEIDDRTRFERELNKYLNLGYEIASSACNSSFYRAILVKS